MWFKHFLPVYEKKSQLTLFLTFSGIVSFGLNFKKQKSSKQCPSTKSWKIFLLIQFDWEENAKTKSWKWVKKLKGTIVIPRIILRWIILHWDPPFKCPQLTEMSSTEMSSAVIRYNDYNSNTILLSPNTSWNKKINTQIPSFRLINPIIQSFCTTLRVYCISNPRVGFGYTIILYYSTSLVYIKLFLYHHFVLLYKFTVHQIQKLDLAIPSFRTTLRV